MPPKKETENTVKQGLTNKNVYWINMKVYQMLPNNELVFAGGGICEDKETELVKAFIKRNKKVYQIYENLAVIEYNEVIKFGKYLGKKVDEIKDLDAGYLRWLIKNYTFKVGEENLKKEIITILK